MICSFKGLLIIWKIFSEYFGHISFGKINSRNIFYLIRRVNHDGIMMEDHYLLYGLFLSWGKLYIGPQKNTKKLRVFCVFFPKMAPTSLVPKVPPQIRPMWNYFGTIRAFGHLCSSPEVTQKIWSKWPKTL